MSNEIVMFEVNDKRTLYVLYYLHKSNHKMKYTHAYENLFQEDQTYVADLEFAARIGKILLEQNKELEDHSRILQEKICDQDSKIMVRF